VVIQTIARTAGAHEAIPPRIVKARRAGTDGDRSGTPRTGGDR
jgi:hypothetical protein